ncbi:hypothetical protein U1Q18_044563 [Sarracenia purpurea var. burkii]
MFKEIRVWSSGGLVVKMREVGAVRRGSLTARKNGARPVHGDGSAGGATSAALVRTRDSAAPMDESGATCDGCSDSTTVCKAVLTTVPQGSAFDYGIDGKIACESQIARQWVLRRRV